MPNAQALGHSLSKTALKFTVASFFPFTTIRWRSRLSILLSLEGWQNSHKQNLRILSLYLLIALQSKFCLEFCFSSRILSEFRYHSRISLNTNIMIDTYPCLDIKILLRILFSQQNFVRILISQQNFVSNRHHYLHLPSS